MAASLRTMAAALFALATTAAAAAGVLVTSRVLTGADPRCDVAGLRGALVILALSGIPLAAVAWSGVLTGRPLRSWWAAYASVGVLLVAALAFQAGGCTTGTDDLARRMPSETSFVAPPKQP